MTADPDRYPRSEAEAQSPLPTGEQLRQEAEERPKSLRLLPRITADAVRLVWAASPRMLIASIGLKLVNGAGLAAALIFGKNLIGSVLSADTGSAATAPGIGAVAPQLALVVGIVAVLGLVTAAGREVREILSETTARHAKQAIIDVANQVELSAYETPSFHDRLVRAASGEHRPIQMVDGLIGTIGAIASIGGHRGRAAGDPAVAGAAAVPGRTAAAAGGDEGRAGHVRLPHAHDHRRPGPQLPVPAADREGPGQGGPRVRARRLPQRPAHRAVRPAHGRAAQDHP